MSEEYHYTVREPWQWVMTAVANDQMTEVELTSDLPFAKKVAADGLNEATAALETPKPQPPSRANSTARRQRRAKERRAVIPSTLRIEKTNPATGEIEMVVHGTSSALDSLEDKDELVRTIQRCKVEQVNLSPPAVLINWDVSKDECKRVLGENLPVLPGNKSEVVYAVLKEPMGSRGEGIFFVKDAEAIHEIIAEHRQMAQKEPGFLDKLIDSKGRIPSWVLQAEVTPAMLINGTHKFHLRSYLVVLENLGDPDLIETFIYNRHEVRMAMNPVASNPDDRDPEAHITNGSFTDTKRDLVSNVPELEGFQDKLETFLATTFGKHLLPDMIGRVRYSASQDTDVVESAVRKFAIAGVDMMVAEDGRIYLLEVNVNPSVPPENLVDDAFKKHLTGFMQDMIDLVTSQPYHNFLLVSDILERKGLLD